jgi:hypothetical protein
MTQTALAKEIFTDLCESHTGGSNENADRVSRDLLGLELGEVGGSLLRSPVSMQANTAANIKYHKFLLCVAYLQYLPVRTVFLCAL